VGTAPVAAPGGSYTITMTAKSASGKGKVNLSVSCSDWATKSQYSTLAGSSKPVFSHNFGKDYETVSGAYTAPDDVNAWLLQGMLEFVDSTDYDVSYFSIKRTKTTDTTDDFRMSLSGKSYQAAGKLKRFATKDFSINPVDLADHDGVIKFTASIKGNHFGMARLIYHGPLLMGRNARYRVNSVNGNAYDLTLTAGLSGYSKIFKLFPFSTKYGGIEIRADDDSSKNHTSKNKNQWITSDFSAPGKKILIIYPTQAPPPKAKETGKR